MTPVVQLELTFLIWNIYFDILCIAKLLPWSLVQWYIPPLEFQCFIYIEIDQ